MTACCVVLCTALQRLYDVIVGIRLLVMTTYVKRVRSSLRALGTAVTTLMLQPDRTGCKE